MSAGLLELLGPIHWPLFALVSARVAGLLVLAPLWSMRAIPGQIRAAMAVAMTLALLPVAGRMPLPVDAPLPLLGLVTEFALGAAIGLTAAVFIYGLTVAAEVISLQMGLSLGVAFGGLSDVGTPGIGQLYGQMALVMFAALGGHVVMIAGVGHSFLVLPPGSALNHVNGSAAMLAIAGTVFTVAIRVAAPVMVALLITNLSLAVLNRAVPQLNTMMVAVPITVAVGLVAIGASLSLVGAEMTRWVAGLDDTIAQLITVMRPLTIVGP
jgi:flagellar biosynthetic protein FliR